MLMCNAASGYNYGQYMTTAMQSAGFSAEDIGKVKIWSSGYPKEPNADCGSIPKSRSAIQNDDADQQNPGSSSRDMGNFGCVLVKGCPVNDHRGFETTLCVAAVPLACDLI
jgi:alpha-amylase